MKRFLVKFAAPAEIVKIIVKYQPLYLAYVVPQIIVNAVLPLLYVYFPKLIIERLTTGSSYTAIAELIGIYAGILLIINIARTIVNSKSSLHAQTFSRKLKKEIGIITMKLDLVNTESAGFRDIIQIANNATGLTETMGYVQSIVSKIITILGLSYIIVQLDWFFILLVFITLSVKIVFVYLRYSYNKEVRRLYAKNDRLGNYLTGIAYFDEGGAKEIRVNNLQDWFMGKIKGFRNEMVTAQYRDFSRSALFNIVIAVIMTFQSFVVLWLLSIRYIEGTLSIADFTMYFSAVASITIALSSVADQIGDYNKQVLNVSDYKRLIHIKDFENNGAKESCNHSVSYPFEMPPDKIEFVFRNVSFAYPNTDKKVLENINLTISDKEKLVLVGFNGAGKTTLIKLLCKFYRPTSGTITLNGVDIWDIPNSEYYKVIATVFQDFANLSFSLKENVSMSEEGDIEKVSRIMDELGLGEYAKSLPNGYDTYLSRNFDSMGTELSGGQGQKVAIARAVYKDTPVLILDEPTANLDPKAESEIYTNFFNLAKNKTTIFISHRLAASTIADNIVVFSDGRIEEYGSHSTLIRKNGVYAEMYRKQSRAYIDEIWII